MTGLHCYVRKIQLYLAKEGFKHENELTHSGNVFGKINYDNTRIELIVGSFSNWSPLIKHLQKIVATSLFSLCTHYLITWDVVTFGRANHRALFKDVINVRPFYPLPHRVAALTTL